VPAGHAVRPRLVSYVNPDPLVLPRLPEALGSVQNHRLRLVIHYSPIPTWEAHEIEDVYRADVGHHLALRAVVLSRELKLNGFHEHRRAYRGLPIDILRMSGGNNDEDEQ